MSVVTHRAAVLGSPISHSLSPVLHSAAYAALGLTGWQYEAIDCNEQQLPALVAQASSDWVGFSVTMPGKAAAAAVAQTRSPRVNLLGVANTLYRGPDGVSWAAENTDVDGIVGALQAVDCAPQVALVIGGGGTALAAVAALAELGAKEITFAGRRPESTEQAQALATKLGMVTSRVSTVLNAPPEPDPQQAVEAANPTLHDRIPSCDLVLSTIPAGTADHLAEALAKVPVLFDAIYHPWPTPLAAAGGPTRRTVTGLDMLLHQALRQVELMTGQTAPAQQMRSALLAATGMDIPLPI